MQLSTMSYEEIAFFIADPLTNMGRQRDSNKNSVDNVKNRSAMVASGGWSPEFPAVIVPMTSWPFVAAAVTGGMPAQDYIDKEMERRAAVLAQKKLNATKDAESLLGYNCFVTLYCGEDGELIQLTIDNAYWVNSGHQRTEFVYYEAYCEYCRQKAENDKLPVGDRVTLKEFSLKVPALIGVYTDLNDILSNQLGANTSSAIQNRLTVLDLTKAAVFAIGKSEAPLVNEREFRRMTSQNSLAAGKGANDGGAPRHAYLIAYVNWIYRFACGLVRDLNRPKDLPNATGEGNVPNPDYIDIADVALNHDDPRHNISVIARLVQPGLGKLSDYNAQYGPNSKGFLADPKKNPDRMSAIEKEVLARSKEWSAEELKDWEQSMKKNGGSYAEPPAAKVKANDKETVEALSTLVTSTQVPTAIRAYLGEKLSMSTDLTDLSAIPTGASAKILDNANEIDAIFKLDRGIELDATFLRVISKLDLLREGDSDAYGKLLHKVAKDVDKAVPDTTDA